MFIISGESEFKRVTRVFKITSCVKILRQPLFLQQKIISMVKKQFSVGEYKVVWFHPVALFV